MGKFSRMGHALYEGHISIDFVGRRRLWYAISGLIVVIAASGLWFKGLNLGIEFEGGVEYTVQVQPDQRNQATVDDVRQAVAATGIPEAASPIATTSGKNIRVQTETMSSDKADIVSAAIAKATGVPDSDISTQEIGPSWGSQVRDRAITGLIVFLVLVVLFIWAYFREWKMSVGAMVALAHDLVITVGVYALSGFEVTPATVTGVLTILGFSLYDTVVVFDKVRENTKDLRQSRQTYAELANLAINQTLVRSINTSIVALLPVGALLYVGIFQLGSGALKDLSLALFVGMAAGAYSSIFIATPLVAQLKSLGFSTTPAAERVAMDDYASWGSRVGGYLLDALFSTLASIPMFVGEIWLVLQLSNGGSLVTPALLTIVGVALSLGFGLWNQVFRQGETGYSLGKSSVGIRVVDMRTGQPIGPARAFLRLLGRIANSLCFMLGWLWPLWDGRKQTFADKLASSVVLNQRPMPSTAELADRRARARAKRDADRYANVPAFTEDMPIADAPEGFRPDPDDPDAPPVARTPFRAPAGGDGATGSGRVVPLAKAPVEQSGSAKRNQPSRQPRSKRGK